MIDVSTIAHEQWQDQIVGTDCHIGVTITFRLAGALQSWTNGGTEKFAGRITHGKQYKPWPTSGRMTV